MRPRAACVLTGGEPACPFCSKRICRPRDCAFRQAGVRRKRRAPLLPLPLVRTHSKLPRKRKAQHPGVGDAGAAHSSAFRLGGGGLLEQWLRELFSLFGWLFVRSESDHGSLPRPCRFGHETLGYLVLDTTPLHLMCPPRRGAVAAVVVHHFWLVDAHARSYTTASISESIRLDPRVAPPCDGGAEDLRSVRFPMRNQRFVVELHLAWPKRKEVGVHQRVGARAGASGPGVAVGQHCPCPRVGKHRRQAGGVHNDNVGIHGNHPVVVPNLTRL